MGLLFYPISYQQKAVYMNDDIHSRCFHEFERPWPSRLGSDASTEKADTTSVVHKLRFVGREYTLANGTTVPVVEQFTSSKCYCMHGVLTIGSGLLGGDLLQLVVPFLGLPTDCCDPVGIFPGGGELLPSILFTNVAVNGERIAMFLSSLLAGAAEQASIIRFAVRVAAGDTSSATETDAID